MGLSPAGLTKPPSAQGGNTLFWEKETRAYSIPGNIHIIISNRLVIYADFK